MLRMLRCRLMGVWMAAWMCGTSPLMAQIRIIPQATRDSVTNPLLLADSPMLLANDGAVDFGTLSEEAEPWQGSLRWRNVGREPLLITRITSSCGCLQADAERRPVQPEEEAVVRLTYRPKGHPGTVYQRLFVYTNRSNSRPTAILTLRGVVTPSKALAANYPCAMGPLRLRTTEVQLGTGEREVRIACRNVGEKPLCVRLDTLLSPRGWQLESEPRILQAGEEGDVVIRRTTLREGDTLRLHRLVVGGLHLPPRARTVTLHTKND